MLWCENSSRVSLTKEPILTGMTMHIEARYYFIKELVQAKRLTRAHISGVDNMVGIFTKPLPQEDHARLITMLLVVHA